MIEVIFLNFLKDKYKVKKYVWFGLDRIKIICFIFKENEGVL